MFSWCLLRLPGHLPFKKLFPRSCFLGQILSQIKPRAIKEQRKGNQFPVGWGTCDVMRATALRVWNISRGPKNRECKHNLSRGLGAALGDCPSGEQRTELKRLCDAMLREAADLENSSPWSRTGKRCQIWGLLAPLSQKTKETQTNEN